MVACQLSSSFVIFRQERSSPSTSRQAQAGEGKKRGLGVLILSHYVLSVMSGYLHTPGRTCGRMRGHGQGSSDIDTVSRERGVGLPTLVGALAASLRASASD